MLITAVIVLFLAAILFSSLKISAVATHGETDTDVTVKATFWFFSFTVYRSGEGKKISDEEKPSDKKEGEAYSMKNIEDIFHTFLEVFKKLKKNLVIRCFSLKVALGMKDAANTGIATGAAWAALYNMVSLLQRYFTLKQYEVNVQPSFNNERFDVFFEGVFSIRIIHIFAILTSLVKGLAKMEKTTKSINV